MGIILVAILSVFSSGFSNIAFSGQKSKELMNVQSIVDDLNAQDLMTTASHSAQYYIVNYLTGKTYNSVSALSQVTVNSGNDVNFYVSPQETKAGTAGNSVTIVKFTQNGKRYAQLSTFLPDRGA